MANVLDLLSRAESVITESEGADEHSELLREMREAIADLTLADVAALLQASGLRVTIEYPGYLAIGCHRDDWYWQVGTANGTWAGELMNVETGDCLDTIDTGIGRYAEPKRIAAAILNAISDPERNGAKS